MASVLQSSQNNDNDNNSKRQRSRSNSSDLRRYSNRKRPEDSTSEEISPCNINSLNDDMLYHISEFIGAPCYIVLGTINKRCNQFYDTYNKPKKTSLLRHGPIAKIKRKNRKYKLDIGISAITCSRIDVLNWALENQNKLALISICKIACLEGRLDIVHQIKETYHEPDEIFCAYDYWRYAGRNGHLNVIQYLKEQYSYAFASGPSFNWAARHPENNIQVFEWLREYNQTFNERTCSYAAAGGNLENLMWLRREGCPWNEETFICAAAFGHLDLCKWLQENNCPWNEKATLVAETEGHQEILEWLVQHGCPRHSPNQLKTVRWCLELGFPKDRGEVKMRKAVLAHNLIDKRHDYETLEWLFNVGYPQHREKLDKFTEEREYEKWDNDIDSEDEGGFNRWW